jgi:hypothetical protein
VITSRCACSKSEGVTSLQEAIQWLVHRQGATRVEAQDSTSTPMLSGASGALTKRSTMLASELTSTMSNTSSKPAGPLTSRKHEESAGEVPPLAQLVKEIAAEGGAVKARADSRAHGALMAKLLAALSADCNADGAASLPISDVCAAFKVRAQSRLCILACALALVVCRLCKLHALGFIGTTWAWSVARWPWCIMFGCSQAPLSTYEEPTFARQLAEATLDTYDTSRPATMPAAVAAVLATCGQHLATVAAPLRARLVAVAVAQLALMAGSRERAAAMWRRALAAAESGVQNRAGLHLTQLAQAVLHLGAVLHLDNAQQDRQTFATTPPEYGEGMVTCVPRSFC